jgi:hypothetical protein
VSDCKKPAIGNDSNPNGYVNHSKNVLQKTVVQRGKEIIIEFPIVIDDESDTHPQYNPDTVDTWVYPANCDKRCDFNYT